MSAVTISPGGKEKLSAFVKQTASRFPAIFAGITTAEDELYFDQAGDRIYGQPDKGQVGPDTTTEIYSQTKLITQVAVMQLVGDGKVSLDSTDEVEKLLPELLKLPLLKGYEEDGTPILVKATKKPTLRQLCSHTAGCTYGFLDASVAPYIKSLPSNALGALSFLSDTASLKALDLPFVYEPGESFRYSTSIDWAGVLVERVSGQRLEDYFQEHIFKPCGITSMTFYPSQHISDTKVAMCYRTPGGIVPSPDGYSKDRSKNGDAVRKAELLAGGAGLFGTQRDYLAFLRGVLRSDPKFPGEGLLKPEAYAELFKPSLPKGTDAPQKLYQFMSERGYATPEITSPDDVEYSVGGILNLREVPGRRKAMSCAWAGMAKTQFWVDPTTGIAAVFGTQLLAIGPDPWTSEYANYESLVYEVLESGTKTASSASL